MGDTKQKIIDAAMELIRDKGYVAMTTKDIASRAGVNESTLFRKFESKKDIVLSGIKQERWRANLTSKVFQDVKWELEPDLEMFMQNYLERITSDFVYLSIGLRAPQIYQDVKPFIMKVPQSFVDTLTEYFHKMYEMEKIGKMDFECVAMTIFSSAFGFAFLKASFEEKLSKVEQREYIKKSVKLFADGIMANS